MSILSLNGLFGRLHSPANGVTLRLHGVVRGQFDHATYPTCVLLPPRVTQFENPSLLTRIAVHLATRHNLNISSARQLVTSAKLELFGKVRRLEGGDTMCASSLVAHANDRRDATFVRYELLVDRYAHQRNRSPEFELKAFYGQLKHIIVVQIPANARSGLPDGEVLFLVDIQSAKIALQNDLDMHYFSSMGQTEVVDITSVQCLVGRVKVAAGGQYDWAIIDRSGELARAMYTSEGVE